MRIQKTFMTFDGIALPRERRRIFVTGGGSNPEVSRTLEGAQEPEGGIFNVTGAMNQRQKTADNFCGNMGGQLSHIDLGNCTSATFGGIGGCFKIENKSASDRSKDRQQNVARGAGILTSLESNGMIPPSIARVSTPPIIPEGTEDGEQVDVEMQDLVDLIHEIKDMVDQGDIGDMNAYVQELVTVYKKAQTNMNGRAPGFVFLLQQYGLDDVIHPAGSQVIFDRVAYQRRGQERNAEKAADKKGASRETGVRKDFNQPRTEEQNFVTEKRVANVTTFLENPSMLQSFKRIMNQQERGTQYDQTIAKLRQIKDGVVRTGALAGIPNTILNIIEYIFNAQSGGPSEKSTATSTLPREETGDSQRGDSKIISKEKGDKMLARGEAVLGPGEHVSYDGPSIPEAIISRMGVASAQRIEQILLASDSEWSASEKKTLHLMFEDLNSGKKLEQLSTDQKIVYEKLGSVVRAWFEATKEKPQKESDKVMDGMKKALEVFGPNAKVIDEKTGKERPANVGDKFAAIIKLIFLGIQYLQAIGNELSGTQEIPPPREGRGAGPKPGPAEKERERPPQQTRNQEQIASERRQTQERMGAVDKELELEKRHGALLKDTLDSFKRTEGDLAKMLGSDPDPARTQRRQERQQRLQKQIEEVTKDIAALTKEKGELQKKLDGLNGISGGLEARIPFLNAALQKILEQIPEAKKGIGGFDFAVTEQGIVVRLKEPRGFLHELFPNKNEVSIDEIQQRTKEKTEESQKPEAKQELVMERLADRLKDKFERMMEPGKRQDEYATVRNGIRLEAVRDGKFQVYFDFALLQGRLTPVAVQSIKGATRNIRETPGNPVTVTRYTDPLTKEEISAKFGIGGV